MADELEPIGPEVRRQFDETQDAAESAIVPGVHELPWMVPRSQLEALDEEDIRAVVIDQNEKIGRLYGAIQKLAAGNPEIDIILNPGKDSPEA